MAPALSGHISEDYANHFQYLDFGRALYHSKSSSKLKPGVFGFFDSYGEWSHIADLGKPNTLEAFGLSRPKHIVKCDSVEHRGWVEPLKTNSVEGVKIHGEASLDAAGLPASAALGYTFRLHEEFGAVLVTSADVHRERSSLLQPSIEAWFESNLKAILAGELAKTFKDQGLCVITGTYSVTKVLLNAWKGKGTTANCGFNAQALSRVGFKGDGDWYEGHTVGTWISGLAEKRERLVVFASGVKFKYRRHIVKSSSAKTEAIRAEEKEQDNILRVFLEDDANSIVELECESLGGPKDINKDMLDVELGADYVDDQAQDW